MQVRVEAGAYGGRAGSCVCAKETKKKIHLNLNQAQGWKHVRRRRVPIRPFTLLAPHTANMLMLSLSVDSAEVDDGSAGE